MWHLCMNITTESCFNYCEAAVVIGCDFGNINASNIHLLVVETVFYMQFKAIFISFMDIQLKACDTNVAVFQKFARESVLVGEDQLETVVRVTRTESNLTTVWTLEKFDERLTAMREIYNVRL